MENKKHSLVEKRVLKIYAAILIVNVRYKKLR